MLLPLLVFCCLRCYCYYARYLNKCFCNIKPGRGTLCVCVPSNNAWDKVNVAAKMKSNKITTTPATNNAKKRWIKGNRCKNGQTSVKMFSN